MVAPASELCPTRGWVTRDIPGAGEYQVFRCTPGQPVVIDVGLQTVGRQEALARHGANIGGLGDLGDLGDFLIGNISIPTWGLLAAAGALAFMVLGKRRR